MFVLCKFEVERQNMLEAVRIRYLILSYQLELIRRNSLRHIYSRQSLAIYYVNGQPTHILVEIQVFCHKCRFTSSEHQQYGDPESRRPSGKGWKMQFVARKLERLLEDCKWVFSLSEAHCVYGPIKLASCDFCSLGKRYVLAAGIFLERDLKDFSRAWAGVLKLVKI